MTGVVDRLSDLRGSGAAASRNPVDVEAGMAGPGPTSSPFMLEFFDTIAEVKTLMSTIRYNLRELEEAAGDCLTATTSEGGREATARFEALMKQNNAAAQKVRKQLKLVDAENKEFAKRNKGSSEARIRANVHGALTRKFIDLMTDYQEVQSRYKARCRERVKRQVKIVKPDATEEEVELALDDGSQPEIFTQQLLQGPGHAAARNALADIQDRHRDIVRLEASIAELHQLFLDMSVLVESQGELLDQIEYTVSQSVNYTGQAIEELKTASKYQKKIRKKICCLFIVVLVAVVIILATVLPTTLGR